MKKTTKKIPTIINFILDNTGSMMDIKERTISGFNEYVESLKQSAKKTGGTLYFTLTKFNSYQIERPYLAVDIKKVAKLTDTTYQPNGNTPLYDACVDTIEAAEEEIKKMEGPIASLVVIMTDGEENSSRKHNEQCLSDLIGKLQKRGNWTFVFLGANQDAWKTGQTLGISAGNTMSWDATDAGASQVFACAAANSVNYSVNMMRGNMGKGLSESNFFNQDVATDTLPKGGGSNAT
jgi:hypothetical protein